MPEFRLPLFGPSGARPRVKVCGLTRLRDARLAWELGASALGFIFHPRSPRFVKPEEAKALRARLPREACCVGVFVDRNPEEVERLATFVGLDAIQLHGFEPESSVRAFSLPVMKLVRDMGEALSSPAALVLMDASLPGIPGGTGLRADWDLASRIAAQRPLVLAGGIGPDNTLAALERVRPHALDVNSAVELAPGIKDSGRLKELFYLLERMTSAVPS